MVMHVAKHTEIHAIRLETKARCQTRQHSFPVLDNYSFPPGYWGVSQRENLGQNETKKQNKEE